MMCGDGCTIVVFCCVFTLYCVTGMCYCEYVYVCSFMRVYTCVHSCVCVYVCSFMHVYISVCIFHEPLTASSWCNAATDGPDEGTALKELP